jgi:outer membrane protein assembly factor BamD (BamD/ComL family)
MRILTVITVVLLFSISGCKKESKSSETSEEPVKTAAEYDAEAKKDINEENMNQELDKLEQDWSRRPNRRNIGLLSLESYGKDSLSEMCSLKYE